MGRTYLAIGKGTVDFSTIAAPPQSVSLPVITVNAKPQVITPLNAGGGIAFFDPTKFGGDAFSAPNTNNPYITWVNPQVLSTSSEINTSTRGSASTPGANTFGLWPSTRVDEGQVTLETHASGIKLVRIRQPFPIPATSPQDYWNTAQGTRSVQSAEALGAGAARPHSAVASFIWGWDPQYFYAHEIGQEHTWPNHKMWFFTVAGGASQRLERQSARVFDEHGQSGTSNPATNYGVGGNSGFFFGAPQPMGTALFPGDNPPAGGDLWMFVMGRQWFPSDANPQRCWLWFMCRQVTQGATILDPTAAGNYSVTAQPGDWFGLTVEYTTATNKNVIATIQPAVNINAGVGLFKLQCTNVVGTFISGEPLTFSDGGEAPGTQTHCKVWDNAAQTMELASWGQGAEHQVASGATITGGTSGATCQFSSVIRTPTSHYFQFGPMSVLNPHVIQDPWGCLAAVGATIS